MPVSYIQLILALALLFGACKGAQAAPACWNSSGVGFNFGTVTAGQEASTSARLVFTCNNYDTVTQYVRACMTIQDQDPLSMNRNGSNNSPLYFHLYPGGEIAAPLSQTSTIYARQDFVLPTRSTLQQTFPLVAKISPGQTALGAGDYYNYGFWSRIKFTWATERSQLPSCAAMAETTIRTVELNARAIIKNGCAIDNVSDLNFGEFSPATTRTLSGAATANIRVRCPVGTAFSIGLGDGLNGRQGHRYMCNASECLSYELYQDTSHTAVWNDSNMATFTSATGDSQTLVVYGQVPEQNWPTPGAYTDTVTVTLKY